MSDPGKGVGETSLRELLRLKVPTIGTWLSLGNEDVAELMVKCGFDWLVIDMEHSATSLPQAHNLIRVIELGGSKPLVRVRENQPSLIKQAMDAGAHGVIVPMVNSREDAEAAVRAVRYAPEGSRGTGLWRAQGYGMSFDEYREWLSKESVVIVQIEHIEAVDRIDEILTTPGVDGFFVGPYDLSSSLNSPGDFTTPEFMKAMRTLEERTQAGPWAAGYHVVFPDLDEVAQRLEVGYSFIALSVDMIFLWTSAKKALDEARGILSDAGQGSVGEKHAAS